jgi:hypothetical protein
VVRHVQCVTGSGFILSTAKKEKAMCQASPSQRQQAWALAVKEQVLTLTRLGCNKYPMKNSCFPGQTYCPYSSHP